VAIETSAAMFTPEARARWEHFIAQWVQQGFTIRARNDEAATALLHHHGRIKSKAVGPGRLFARTSDVVDTCRTIWLDDTGEVREAVIPCPESP
jgi:hypothetical protein